MKIFLTALCFSSGAFAGVSRDTSAPGIGHKAVPDIYFLEHADVADSYFILPEPPDTASLEFQYDIARYKWGKSLRDTPRGDLAVLDSRLTGIDLADAFSEAFGLDINQQSTPQIYKLINGMREDAGNLAVRDAKLHYRRMRPFLYFNEMTCNPEHQSELAGDGSFPSGHTSIGWATALVLSEINPDRQNEILKRGFEIGESRVICGYHWQSDVNAARIVAAGLVARLHAEKSFARQLKKAKKEFSKLKKRLDK